MSKQVNIEGHGMVDLVERKGGWITFMSSDGTVKKVRSSKEVKDGATPASTADKAPAKATKSKAKGSKRKPAGDDKSKGRKIGKSPVRRFAEYERVKTAEGTVTFDCGDKIAKALRGMEIDEVYEAAARALKKSGDSEGTIAEIADELRDRYGDLNDGMQRMNLGNRIRGAGGLA